ncbi:MAG: hypothetical protein AAF798_22515 [Bacteroidota bacterium]
MSRILFFLLISVPLTAQQTIYLENPSFEDTPRFAKSPKGWEDCGSPGESPPDVQPCGTFMTVPEPPLHGSTYLGMVVRDNWTMESVGQKLSQPLVAGQTYRMSIWVLRSRIYISQSRLYNEEVNYVTPVILELFAGNRYCKREEILFESDYIETTVWKELPMTFQPSKDYKYIGLRIKHQKGEEPIEVAFTGNLMLDHCSPIFPIENDRAAIPASFLPVREQHPQWWDASQHTEFTLTDIFQAAVLEMNEVELAAFRQKEAAAAALLNVLRFDAIRQKKGLDLAFLSQSMAELEQLERDWETLNFTDWAILTQNVRTLLWKGQDDVLSMQELKALTSFKASPSAGSSIGILCKEYIATHRTELLELLNIK